MNKTEFIAAVAAKEGLEKKTAEKAVNAVIACIGRCSRIGRQDSDRRLRHFRGQRARS